VAHRRPRGQTRSESHMNERRSDSDIQQRDAPTDVDAYISPSRLARYWGVHPNTIRRDIKKGALRASRLPGGQFRIRWIDARRYGRPVE
jgi:excisionase family DNA binding protein